MLTFVKLYAAARALMFALPLAITATSVGSAATKSTAIKTVAGIDWSAIRLPPKTKTIPFRFFTINQVLSEAGVKLAATPVAGLALIHPSGTTTDESAISPVEPTPRNQPFGMVAFRAPEGSMWVKWRNLESEIRADAKVLADCRAAPDRCRSPAAGRFQAIVDNGRAQQGRARIAVINRSINAAISYVSDLTQYGVLDLWSSPLTTFNSGRGDCEDYAIAKYVALREAGVDADDLRLLIGREGTLGQDHAVLSVRNGGRWLILDNRHSLLVDSADASHFVPLFAVNDRGVNVLAAPYAAFVQREL
jgi:predicted transglutaminase-like cysteine proteinase